MNVVGTLTYTARAPTKKQTKKKHIYIYIYNGSLTNRYTSSEALLIYQEPDLLAVSKVRTRRRNLGGISELDFLDRARAAPTCKGLQGNLTSEVVIAYPPGDAQPTRL